MSFSEKYKVKYKEMQDVINKIAKGGLESLLLEDSLSGTSITEKYSCNYLTIARENIHNLFRINPNIFIGLTVVDLDVQDDTVTVFFDNDSVMTFSGDFLCLSDSYLMIDNPIIEVKIVIDVIRNLSIFIFSVEGGKYEISTDGRLDIHLNGKQIIEDIKLPNLFVAKNISECLNLISSDPEVYIKQGYDTRIECKCDEIVYTFSTLETKKEVLMNEFKK